MRVMRESYLCCCLLRPAGRSDGIPFHAVELCEWLQQEGMVGDGHLPAKIGKLTSVVPPSMQALVQSQLDQLPTVPGVILRCASILSSPFSLDALLHMMPKRIVDCSEMLESQMMVLRNAHLVDRDISIMRTSSSLSLTEGLMQEPCEAGHRWKVGHPHQYVMTQKKAGGRRGGISTKLSDLDTGRAPPEPPHSAEGCS